MSRWLLVEIDCCDGSDWSGGRSGDTDDNDSGGGRKICGDWWWCVNGS